MTFVRKLPLIVFSSLSIMIGAQALASINTTVYSFGNNTAKQTELEEKNKDIVKTGVSLFTDQNIDLALELLPNYFSEDYIQHNPFVPDGLDTVRLFFILNRPDGLMIEPSVAFAEKDFVVTYSLFDTVSQARPLMAVDVFRIENSLIAEHWDTIEEEKLPSETVSGNAMYPILLSSDPLGGFPKFNKYKANGHAKTFIQESIEGKNKTIVKVALNALFSHADYRVLTAFWDENVIQHNPNIDNGLSALIEYYSDNQSGRITYEAGFILADDNFVFAHNRVTGLGPSPVIVAQFFKLERGKIVEQWEITQLEIPAENTVSGNPMFPIE